MKKPPPLRFLSPAQVAQFKRDGVLVIPQVIDKALVDDTR
jgi:hypothetical protein